MINDVGVKPNWTDQCTNDPIAFKSSDGFSIPYGNMTLIITLKKQSNDEN